MSSSVTTEMSYSINIKKKNERIEVSLMRDVDDDSGTIVSIRPDTVASNSSLKPGDKIVSINGNNLMECPSEKLLICYLNQRDQLK